MKLNIQLTRYLLIVIVLIGLFSSNLEAAHWEWENPLPQGNELNAVWGIATDNAFAVGGNGTILHTSDGVNWTPMESGTTERLSGVWGADFSNVYAVGDRGTILKFNGNTWTTMASNTTQTLWAVWGSDANNVFATGYSGDIFNWNGTVWSQVDHGDITNATLYGIWGTGPDDIWVVGSTGTIMHKDATGWSLVDHSDITIERDLFSVWGDGTNLFIAANNGVIWQYDGTTWSDSFVGTWAFRSIWGDPGNDVFAVHNFGGIYRYNYSTWTQMTSNTTAHINGVWGTATDEMIAVGSSGTILAYDSINWSPMTHVLTVENQTDIWGSSASDIFSVGDAGSIMHFDGDSWSLETSNTSTDLEAVWGSGAEDVFAVGWGGNFTHYSGGGTWTQDNPGTPETLLDVWGTAANDVFVTGDNNVWGWDGNSWTSMVGGPGGAQAVWGASPTDVWAITSSDVYHYDGSAWTTVSDVPSIEMEDGDIWGSSSDDIYIVGRYGGVLHFDGGKWDTLELGGGDLTKVWGIDAAHVYIVGADDIWFFNGNRWRIISNDSMPNINSIWADADDNVYAVGSDGAVLRYTYQSYYVDSTGTDDPAFGGTSGTGAWKTIHYAVSQINAMPVGNYVINVAAGTYSVTNGEENADLTITQDNVLLQGETGVILDGEYAANAWNFGVTIDASNVILKDLAITRFRDDGNPGIVVNSGANNLIEDCDLFDNDRGIRLYSVSTGTEIVTSSFYNNTTAILSNDAEMTVSGNKIYENDSGIECVNYNENININIFNNLFYGTDPQHFIGVNVDVSSGSTAVTLHHNTIAAIGNAINLYHAGQTSTLNADVKYNIVAGATVGVEFNDGIGGTLTGSDYNTVFNCTTPYTNVTPGANDSLLDPLFVDENGFDFHLQELSPARNAIPLTENDPVSDDLGGVSRPQGDGYDMGAYEKPLPLAVLSVGPANGAVGVIVGAAVTTIFSEAVDPTSVTAASIAVSSGGTAIPGSFAIDGAMVSFTPDSALDNGRVYNVRISTDVTDTGGTPLEAVYTWSFTTVGSAAQGASFPTQFIISTDAMWAFSVIASDIDDDGDLDVISASDADDTVEWFSNTDGDGTFGPPQTIWGSAVGARSVFAADITGDGIVDVLSASWGPTIGVNPDMEFAWYENAFNTQPAGNFSSQNVLTSHSSPISIIAADLDNDGDLDVLTASYGDNTVAWIENADGTGGEWNEHIISNTDNAVWDVFAADLDNDGDLDVLSASNTSNDLTWYENRLNEATQNFGPEIIISNSASGARVVRAADLDQDGDMDVVSASWFDGKIAWYENQGGTFGDPASNQNLIATAEVFTQAMHVADMDNDGDMDVLYGSWRDDDEELGEHKIVWMENADGSGTTWTSHDISTAIDGCQSLYAADLDNDGDLDVLSASQDDNKIAWYENTNTMQVQYSLTVNYVGQGSIDQDPAGTVFDPDTVVSLTPFANDGYYFSEWRGALSGSTVPDTVTMDADKTVTVVFLQKTPPDPPATQGPFDEDIIPAGEPVPLETSNYHDPDGDDHVETIWEVWRADNGVLLPGYQYTDAGLTDHVIPDNLLEEGLKYGWRVAYVDADGNPRWSEEYFFKVGTPVSEALPEVAAGTSLGDFGMISIVHWPDDPDPQEVFDIEYNPNQYRIGAWDPEQDRYIEFGDGLEMEPGRAVWILTRDPLVVNFKGIKVSLDHYMEVCLHTNPTTDTGWNMIAPPNEADYDWSQVEAGVWNEDDDIYISSVPIGELTDDTVIDRKVWEWSDGDYQSHMNSTSFVLKHYKGYWVKGMQKGAYLVFPIHARVAGLSTPRNTMLAWKGKAVQWIKTMIPQSRAALADNDSPPMPMGLFEDSVDPVFEGCFIETVER